MLTTTICTALIGALTAGAVASEYIDKQKRAQRAAETQYYEARVAANRAELRRDMARHGTIRRLPD
jgi:hypothetical protein